MSETFLASAKASGYPASMDKSQSPRSARAWLQQVFLKRSFVVGHGMSNAMARMV